MSHDDLIRNYPEVHLATSALFSIFIPVYLVGLLAGLWFGRKHLKVVIPLALVVLLYAAIAIPSVVPGAPYGQRDSCIANMKVIQQAKAQWAADNGKKAADVPLIEDLFGKYKYIREQPLCLRGGTYAIGSVGTNVTCSYADLGHRLPTTP